MPARLALVAYAAALFVGYTACAVRSASRSPAYVANPGPGPSSGGLCPCFRKSPPRARQPPTSSNGGATTTRQPDGSSLQLAPTAIEHTAAAGGAAAAAAQPKKRGVFGLSTEAPSPRAQQEVGGEEPVSHGGNAFHKEELPALEKGAEYVVCVVADTDTVAG